jgi:hypothetical protein
MNYLWCMTNLKLILSALFITAISGAATAQDTVKTASKVTATSIDNQTVYTAIEKEPQFQGSFGDFLSANIRYSAIDKLVGLSGKAFIQFIIEEDGSVSHVRSLRNISPRLEAEAIRVISLSPKWIPGTQNGKPVRCLYTVPINFNADVNKTSIEKLQNSAYGFVMMINGDVYTLDDAKAKLGDVFDPAMVERVDKYSNPKYAMPGKNGVYVIIMKG